MATDYFQLMRLLAGEEHDELARLGYDWRQVRQMFRDTDTSGNELTFDDRQWAAYCWEQEWHWILDRDDATYYYENCVEC